MKPKIAIIVCGLTENRQFVTNAYIQSVRYSGGLPLIVPLVKSNTAISEYISLCDGFLFCGGEDITPLLFGQEPLDKLGKTDITLDIFQLRFMRNVLLSGKPILSICRGMQLLNVACGGTICQDISLKQKDCINHMQHSARKDISHKVIVKSGSLLHRLVGKIIFTNSFHHQAVDMTGKGLIASAHTSDGIIEGIELTDYSFAVGIQWHPEAMYRSTPAMRKLFSAFIHTSRLMSE
ncbi:MAG: gamma-glutamyl-gamma-aminobutyrate hydrolase family protein [Lachnospiraceae bacterium]|nr:gamma-glutamyl-gamma-aminobutyrate hydrolase family protein [Lachnospiraceae bacterium]